MSHMALFLVVGVVLLSTVTVSTQSGNVVTVTVGQNVTLNCSTSETIRDIKKVLVEWKHAGSDILVFKNNRSDFECKDFEGRVKLAHCDLRHGNLSMVLKNAMLKDKGKYKCSFKGESSRKKRAAGPVVMKTIDLRVVAPGRHLDGVGAGVAVLGLLVAVIVLMHRFKKSQNPQNYPNTHNDEINPLESDPPQV